MNPIDALDPNITDERWAEFYGDAVTDYVRNDYSISAVRHDDKVEAHKWLTKLLLQIHNDLADWDTIPIKLSNLLAEVKRLREIEREWKQMWSKLEDYPEICAELICFMESEEE